MRIVAGKYRRRKLLVNPGLTTRPITDRVKEFLFEMLGSELEGARVADIFSGTGSLGLEALSRGAAGCVFIEQDRRAHELLTKNVAMLGVQSVTLCWHTDAIMSSFRPQGVPHLRPFDVIFFDPPYRMVEWLRPGTPLWKALERLARDEVSAPGALLILRTPEEAAFEMPSIWVRDVMWPMSSMELHVFRKQTADEHP